MEIKNLEVNEGFVDPEPFDIALVLYYRKGSDLRRYRALVPIGAEAGDPLAEYAVATWYLHGQRELGVRRNTRKAVEMLQRAAASSFNRAMYDLAVCYEEGFGVPRNTRRAYALYKKAAEQVLCSAMSKQPNASLRGSAWPRTRKKRREYGAVASASKEGPGTRRLRAEPGRRRDERRAAPE